MFVISYPVTPACTRTNVTTHLLPVGYASLTYTHLWIQSEAKGMMNKAGYKTKQKHFPAADEHNLNSRGQHKYRFQDAIS